MNLCLLCVLTVHCSDARCQAQNKKLKTQSLSRSLVPYGGSKLVGEAVFCVEDRHSGSQDPQEGVFTVNSWESVQTEVRGLFLTPSTFSQQFLLRAMSVFLQAVLWGDWQASQGPESDGQSPCACSRDKIENKIAPLFKFNFLTESLVSWSLRPFRPTVFS